MTVNNFLHEQTSYVEMDCFLAELPRFSDCIDLWTISMLVPKLRIYIDSRIELDMRIEAVLSHLKSNWLHYRYVTKELCLDKISFDTNGMSDEEFLIDDSYDMDIRRSSDPVPSLVERIGGHKRQATEAAVKDILKVRMIEENWTIYRSIF